MSEDLKYEMVEYSKDVATSINEFSAYELDVFLCLVYVSRSMLDHRKVSETENLKLELPSSMVKKFLTGAHNSRVKKAIENIFDTKVYLKDDKYTKVRHLFEGLDYSSDYKTIDFELKKEYIKLFYNLSGNFTQHKIKEFTSLKSRYAKRIYQIIMSYKNLYKWEFDAIEFRKILDIPDSYGWSDIDVKLMRKIKVELQNNTNISDISLIKEKSGRNITKVTLKWKLSNTEVLEEIDFIEELEEVIEENILERKQLSSESEKLYENYMKMNDAIKKIIYEKAKNYFLEEIGIPKENKTIDKIWKKTEKLYVVKVMKGDI
ncbi:replication initiation protein [Cetobacterium sp. 2G large]|uniref:replication initiation protein n=1 Tax=Cetobacterium sp. 2G large TaxID=2759680 RepID=UPI00163CC790|nr:replication initiation protein [Cetobacterium sp. 2G large]MBC2852428.1 replication initiation protein [Cetobacterium sp. 2G large]